MSETQRGMKFGPVLATFGHAATSSLEPTDAGYVWRCDCGALGYGLPTSAAASAESRRHIFDAACGSDQ